LADGSLLPEAHGGCFQGALRSLRPWSADQAGGTGGRDATQEAASSLDQCHCAPPSAFTPSSRVWWARCDALSPVTHHIGGQNRGEAADKQALLTRSVQFSHEFTLKFSKAQRRRKSSLTAWGRSGLWILTDREGASSRANAVSITWAVPGRRGRGRLMSRAGRTTALGRLRPLEEAYELRLLTPSANSGRWSPRFLCSDNWRRPASGSTRPPLSNPGFAGDSKPRRTARGWAAPGAGAGTPAAGPGPRRGIHRSRPNSTACRSAVQRAASGKVTKVGRLRSRSSLPQLSVRR